MDQELKQRLIGAAVITALAAIFIPMLFDDPIDESGKSINELTIPELPSKAQDVEIMPLPEKVEDVATVAPVEKPEPPAPAVAYQGDEEADMDVSARPHATITEKETAAAPRPKVIAPEPDMAEDVDVPPSLPAKPVKTPVQPATPPATPVKSPKLAVVEPAAKPVVVELAAKQAVVEPATKPSAAVSNATVRWYLNAGSFSKKENAVALMDNLKKQGFAASLKEAASDKGTVYKVRVGPMLDKAKAQEVKAKLAQINVNSFVSGDE